MRAVGLFAAARDAEGMAAAARAGRESAWREYLPEEVEARWRLHQDAYAYSGAFPRAVIAYSTLLPQHARLRALARLLLFKAAQQEKAGHPKQGLKIREDLRRCGDLMRVQSSGLIGSLVGIAISAIATGNPGGAVPPRNGPGLPPEQSARRRLDLYCDYVTRLGHPEAAARARAEEAARRDVTALAQSPQLVDLPQPLYRLAAWWLAGLTLLANIGWLLVLAGLAAGLARVRRAAPSAAAWGAGLLTLGALGALIFWQAQGLSDLLTAVRSLTGSSDEDAGQIMERRALCAASAVAVPLLLCFVSGIAAFRRRVPVSAGLIRAVRAAALPLACLLAFVWGGLLLGTVRQEGVVNTQTWHSVHDEGPYLAVQAGKPWPGPVR